MYAISLLVDDMGDSAEQPLAVDTGAGCSEVLACNTGNSREAGLGAPPVLQRASFLEDHFSQVCMHLNRKGKKKREREKKKSIYFSTKH